MIEHLDFEIYNRPPYYPQWLCYDDTLTLAQMSDTQLADLNRTLVSLGERYNLDTVQGAELDRLGLLLGVDRKGQRDDLYRLTLELKILLNWSNCSTESVYLASTILYRASYVRVKDSYPAGITIYHNGVDHVNRFSGAYFAGGSRIVFNDGSPMVWNDPDYVVNDMVQMVLAAGVGPHVVRVMPIISSHGRSLLAHDYQALFGSGTRGETDG
jgi:hypothetical protein